MYIYICINQFYDHVYITYNTYTCTVIDYHIPKTTSNSDQEKLGARKLLADVDQIQDVLRYVVCWSDKKGQFMVYSWELMGFHENCIGCFTSNETWLGNPRGMEGNGKNAYK